MNENPEGTGLMMGGSVLLAPALEALVRGTNAGTTCDDVCRRCVYCHWWDKDYGAYPQHDKRCPVRLARELLSGLSHA